MNNNQFNRGGRRGRGVSQGSNKITEAIIASAIEVHRALGPGLLESTYQMCLCQELSIREIRFERQVPIRVEYKGVKLDCGYRADLVVEESVEEIQL